MSQPWLQKASENVISLKNAGDNSARALVARMVNKGV